MSSAVTVTTISFTTISLPYSRSEGTVIPSVKSVSAIAVPSRVTPVTDAFESFTVTVSVTVVTALATSAS